MKNLAFYLPVLNQQERYPQVLEIALEMPMLVVSIAPAKQETLE
jgi:hypothetical protein